MSDAQEFFSGLRQTLVDQGVRVSEEWKPEPAGEPVPWFTAGDCMGGGALFEQEQIDRRMGSSAAGGSLALGVADVRPPQL